MEELIIKEREFRNKIVELINTSGLPAFILKPIIKEVYDQLIILEQQQYEQTQKQNKAKKGDNKND